MTAVEKSGRITFRYVCECADCAEQGRMTLLTNEHGPVVCPAGCGAAYVPWKRPDGKWELKNVVMPVYGDPERGDYVLQDDDDL